MKKVVNFIVDRRRLIIGLYVLLIIVSVIGIFHVNINYDMSKYLPKDSETKAGMQIMSEDFGDMSSITVMFDNLTEEEQLQIKDEIAGLDHVKNVMYFQDDENYQKDNHSKYVISVASGTYSDEAKDVIRELEEKYQGKSIAISGAVKDNDLLVSTLLKEIPVIAIIVVVIIFAILFLLCNSWMEPFLFMGCIGIAIIINMGSNALLPSVSFMTFAIGALLQMGLSMDYSIMLMNRYNQEKLSDTNSASAMKKALLHAFSAITSSSVTTIVGLLVLVFMSFTIGRDMGVVLAKGVLISLICIFTLLPGLIVIFDKAIAKTHKRALKFRMNPLMNFVTKARFVLIPVVVVVLIVSMMVKSGLGISYVKMFENPDQTKTEEVFGVDNPVVLLWNKSEDPEEIRKYIAWLEEQDAVNSVQDYSNTLGKEYTYTELADEMDLEKDQAKLLYQMYADHPNGDTYEKSTPYDLICFLDDNIAGNPAYADFMDADQIAQISDARAEMEEGKAKISDAEKELSDGEQEISDNEKLLSDSEAEITAGEKKLSDSKKQLSDAEKEISDKKKLLSDNEAKITAGEQEIAEGEEQIAAAEQQLAEKETEITAGEQQLTESEQQITEGEQQVAAAEQQLAESETQLTATEQQLAADKEQMKEQGKSEEEIAAELGEREQQLTSQRTQLEASKQELSSKKAELESGRQQLEASKKELESGRAQLEAAKQELLTKKAELESGKQELADGRTQLESGRGQLEAGEQELASGKQEWESGKQELANGRAKLESGWQQLEAGKQELADGRAELEKNKELYEKVMTPKELADAMDLDVSDVKNMLKIRRMSMLDVDKDTLTLEEFIQFITDDVLTDKTYSEALSADMKQEVLDGQKEIDENKGLLLGDNYNRMMVSLALPIEGQETFSFIGQMQEQANKTLSEDFYLVSDSTMGYEMNQGFQDELNFVTILTIVAILIVVFFTFRSVLSSAILVAVIQGAVFIITAIVSLQGTEVNYIALILVQCILMGSTIDYGILFLSNYREIRRTKDKKEAVCVAMNNSINTILTSSLILISSCLTVGLIMTQKIISQTCMIIAYGTICAVILIVFILPALVFTLDRWIIKRKKGDK